MVSIRSAREDEAQELAAIGLRAWESAVAGWGEMSLLRANAESAFVTFTRHSYLTIDVAEKGGQVLGWAARENLDERITDLWIDPIWQRQGFGAALLAHLEAEIEAQGFEVAKIETHAQNEHAIGFLKQMGYSISWMTAVWSPQLDREVDTIGMIKTLITVEQPVVYGEF